MPYNKSFIDQASSVKMAEYWPRSLFTFLWTETKSRSIKTQKENSDLRFVNNIYIWQYLPGGINTLRKRRTIYTWGRKQKADFIFLQETHSKHETERQREKEGERGGAGEESFRDQTDRAVFK